MSLVVGSHRSISRYDDEGWTMAYKHKSNLTGDLTEQIVRTLLMSKGWVILTPDSRDHVYDLAVQLHGNKVETIQVKGLSPNGSFKTTNRHPNSKESVSVGGKQRNCFRYADYGVDWMVGVDIKTYSTYFYPLSVYRNYDVINVNKIGATEFPRNTEIVSNAERVFNLKPVKTLF